MCVYTKQPLFTQQQWYEALIIKQNIIMCICFFNDEYNGEYFLFVYMTTPEIWYNFHVNTFTHSPEMCISLSCHFI